MAVFDKKVTKRLSLDDTEALTVNIENTQNVNGYTEYVIKVQRGPQPEKSWFIRKRYSDFVTLHNLLQVSGINIPLPPKKFIGNMDRNFIAQRQLELQSYLTQLLMNPILASSLCVKKFLDPNNYSLSFQELALQHVSMALRSEVNYDLVKPLPEIGWRIRKHYFLVKSKAKPKSDMLLQWVEFGPDKYLGNKEIHVILKCLLTLNHPHIEKLEYVHCGDSGCFLVRQLHQYGTLKDMVYGSKPKSSFLKKYGSPKQSKPLNVNDISEYGRQIIETLIFLHENGIPFGHLHLGNILLLNKKILLLDIENSILGLSCYYRPFCLQYKKINVMEAIDVYSLGHVLFEMAFGYPLYESVCDNFPPCPPLLCSVLESILSTESCKTGLPTLQELLQHPFFNGSNKTKLTKINFKLTSSVKQSLKASIEFIEKRLQDEQKMIRHYKKMLKIQEILIFEDELSKEKLELEKLENDKSANFTNNVLHLTTNSVSDGGKSRSDSLTSTSTSTSVGTRTSPLPVLASKIISGCSINTSSADNSRSALLDSICTFDKSLLRRQPTSAYSGPNCS